MNIVYLIGNGFDLNLGLKTKYSDFYPYYLKLNSKNDIIKKFKEDLKNSTDNLANLENWSDLELALGDYAKNFQSEQADDFIGLLEDIQDNLADYLQNQTRRINISEADRKKLNNELLDFYIYLTERERLNFNSYKSNLSQFSNDVDVIIFNYKKTFEAIFPINKGELLLRQHSYNGATRNDRIRSVEHIHGTMDNEMILGVNDVSQINNADFQKNIKVIRSMVKPEMNRNAKTIRDNRSVSLIENADVICVFGMSLGETDKLWWQTIIKRLTNTSVKLIIFTRRDEIPLRRYYKIINEKEAIKNKFLNYANLNESDREKIWDRIFVCINSDMFSVIKGVDEKSA